MKRGGRESHTCCLNVFVVFLHCMCNLTEPMTIYSTGVEDFSSSSSSPASPLPLEKPYQQMLPSPMSALMMQATTVPMALDVQPVTSALGPAASVPKSVT